MSETSDFKTFSNFSNNKYLLNLEEHSSFTIDNNFGSILTGKKCAIICNGNFGTLEIGQDSDVLDCDKNHGNLIINSASAIGSVISNAGNAIIKNDCIIYDCSSNTGTFHFWNNCTIGKINNNSGQITIDAHCKIDESIIGNSGTIEIGAHCVVPEIKNNTGSIYIGCNCTVMPSRDVSNATGRIIYSGNGQPYDFGQGTAQTRATTNASSNIANNNPWNDGISACGICLRKVPDTTLRLCGHTCCSICARGLVICHVCREPIFPKIKY